MEPVTTDFNGKPHEVCGNCGSVVGHGCPDSEPCDCDETEWLRAAAAMEEEGGGFPGATGMVRSKRDLEDEAAEAALCSVCRSAVCLSACPNADPCDCEREIDEEHRAGCIFWRTPL